MQKYVREGSENFPLFMSNDIYSQTFTNMRHTKQRMTEGIFDSAKQFTDAFFDGLKIGAVNHALENAKRNPIMPTKLVQKMIEMEKLGKELEGDIKKYGLDKIED